MGQKVSQGVAAASEKLDPGEMIEVIVQLFVPVSERIGTRAEGIAERRRSFQECAEDTRAFIDGLSGRVLEEAWLSSSLRALVPAGRVPELAEREQVERIDVPRVLAAEAGR